MQEEKLNPRQELFCKLYATDREYFGNGTQAYIEAYNIDIKQKGAYASARTGAWENLTKPDILERINELLELATLNDSVVDKQLAFLIEQNADFNAKMGAIREYNKLKKRIQEKLDLTSGGEKITGYTFEVVEASNEEED